jgi:hypothetical protein
LLDAADALDTAQAVANKTAMAVRENLNEWIEDMGRTG